MSSVPEVQVLAKQSSGTENRQLMPGDIFYEPLKQRLPDPGPPYGDSESFIHNPVRN